MDPSLALKCSSQLKISSRRNWLLTTVTETFMGHYTAVTESASSSTTCLQTCHLCVYSTGTVQYKRTFLQHRLQLNHQILPGEHRMTEGAGVEWQQWQAPHMWIHVPWLYVEKPQHLIMTGAGPQGVTWGPDCHVLLGTLQDRKHPLCKKHRRREIKEVTSWKKDQDEREKSQKTLMWTITGQLWINQIIMVVINLD